jgi:murein L,D-transpeptidase YcbB/YkuD
MEIVGERNGLPTIRQKPGSSNALGKVKFIFPNRYSIYLHDTPAKTLFERNRRAFSHGCIRVRQPRELAKLLLSGKPEWSEDSITDAMNSGNEKWVALNEPVPVYITYFTAWVGDLGELNFREDIYGHDRKLARHLFESPSI